MYTVESADLLSYELWLSLSICLVALPSNLDPWSHPFDPLLHHIVRIVCLQRFHGHMSKSHEWWNNQDKETGEMILGLTIFNRNLLTLLYN